jgi:hypothetical protein
VQATVVEQRPAPFGSAQSSACVWDGEPETRIFAPTLTTSAVRAVVAAATAGCLREAVVSTAEAIHRGTAGRRVDRAYLARRPWTTTYRTGSPTTCTSSYRARVMPGRPPNYAPDVGCERTLVLHSVSTANRTSSVVCPRSVRQIRAFGSAHVMIVKWTGEPGKPLQRDRSRPGPPPCVATSYAAECGAPQPTG